MAPSGQELPKRTHGLHRNGTKAPFGQSRCCSHPLSIIVGLTCFLETELSLNKGYMEGLCSSNLLTLFLDLNVNSGFVWLAICVTNAESNGTRIYYISPNLQI